MPNLNDLVADAFIALFQDSTALGYSLSIPDDNIRRFAQAKFKDDELNLVQLPGIAVKVTRGRMVHSRVACYQFTVDCLLNMQADDTSDTTWDTVSGNFESILTIDDLVGGLNDRAGGILVRGIVERIPGAPEIVERHWRQTGRVVLWASLNRV